MCGYQCPTLFLLLTYPSRKERKSGVRAGLGAVGGQLIYLSISRIDTAAAAAAFTTHLRLSQCDRQLCSFYYSQRNKKIFNRRHIWAELVHSLFLSLFDRSFISFHFVGLLFHHWWCR